MSLNESRMLNSKDYSRDGDTEPRPYLVLLHGLFGDLHNLNMVAQALKDRYHIISMDLRNHGRSFHDDHMSYALMAEDVMRTLRDKGVFEPVERPVAAAGGPCRELIMLGHSMGGKVAMEFAMRYPRLLQRLVVADIAPVKYSPHYKAIFKALQTINLDALGNRNDADHALGQHISDRGVRQFLLKNLVLVEGQYQWRFNLEVLVGAYDAVLSGVAEGVFDKPVLFIKGERSDYILEDHREAIVSRFPDVSLKVLAGAGHWLHAEKTDAFVSVVERFLT